jgi:putative nucleotidyltransferase with HDIG domain
MPVQSDTIVARLSHQISELKSKLVQTHRRLRNTQLDTVTALVAAVEARDPYTERHSVHVSTSAGRLAERLNLSKRETEVIKTAAVLHDVGKIGIPDAILAKPGRLTADEYRVVKQHPVTGAAILQSAACLQRELPLVLHHHEWWNGKGYPHGLKREEIPFGARVLQIADSIDAMLSPRSYKQAYDLDRVISELQRGRGAQFDPELADIAIEWLEDKPDTFVRHETAIAVH